MCLNASGNDPVEWGRDGAEDEGRSEELRPPTGCMWPSTSLRAGFRHFTYTNRKAETMRVVTPSKHDGGSLKGVV